MLVGQQGAQTPQRTHINLISHLPSLLSPSMSPVRLTEPHCQTQCPSHQLMPAETLRTAPLPSARDALARGSLQSRELSLLLRACPLRAPVSPALPRTASAPLSHEPPALPLLLPAWVPPPLPPLQQISLKCAAIWFQLSPIFFLVD